MHTTDHKSDSIHSLFLSSLTLTPFLSLPPPLSLSQTQLANNFNSILEDYFQIVDEVSQSKKQGARQATAHAYVASYLAFSSVLGQGGGMW